MAKDQDSPPQQASLLDAGEKVAKLANVGLAIGALNQITNVTDMQAPHMAVLFGPPGFGKTKAAAYLAHPLGKNAVFVSVRMFDTTKTLAQLLALELGIQTKPQWPIATLYDAIVKRLGQLGRPLVIDEIDHIANKSAIEFIRTLHDNTAIPIFLIGEQDIKRKLLAHHERFHDRVLVWREAIPCDLGDVKKLAEHHTPDLEIGNDVLTALLAKTGGVARRVHNELKALREECLKRGVTQPSLDMLSAAGGRGTR